MLKIYRYDGPGGYLGAVVVVIAKDKRQANSIIRKELVHTGVPYGEVNCSLMGDAVPGVVYSDNGDY